MNPYWQHRTLLAVDSSETACSVALWHAGQLTQRIETAARKHSECLLPLIEQLLAVNNLSLKNLHGIAYARGPGAFTGLRLGIALVQGLSLALSIPVIPVSSLLAQAYAGYRKLQQPIVVSALDARMGEIYVAAYQFSTDNQFSTNQVTQVESYQELLPEQVIAPAQLLFPPNFFDYSNGLEWVGVGSGFIFAEQLVHLGRPQQLAVEICCAAENVLCCVLDFNLPAAYNLQQSLPVYLRQPIA